MVGEGLAIKPSNETVCAPVSGTIAVLMDASKHAVGMKLSNGAEILIHVGLNTCKFIGEIFLPQVQAGDIIRRGQLLLTFDATEITRAGFDSTTPIVVTNPENFGDIVFALGGRKIFAQRGEIFYAEKTHSFCMNAVITSDS